MTAKRTRPYYRWPPIIEAAKRIVESYDTRVTLRQLFYRLLAREWILNSDSHYKGLSARTAEGRRDGTLPELMDTTRSITEMLWFTGAREGAARRRHLPR